MEDKKNTKPKQPLCLTYESAKADIFKAITDHIKAYGLPLFLAEVIVADAHAQIKALAQNEKNKAAALYEKQLAEYEAKEGEKCKKQ